MYLMSKHLMAFMNASSREAEDYRYEDSPMNKKLIFQGEYNKGKNKSIQKKSRNLS